jgi:hypothetical protein
MNADTQLAPGAAVAGPGLHLTGVAFREHRFIQLALSAAGNFENQGIRNSIRSFRLMLAAGSGGFGVHTKSNRHRDFHRRMRRKAPQLESRDRGLVQNRVTSAF